MSTAPAPEVRIMVTREMIEAHYKSVMNTAMTLLRQGDMVHAYSVLGNAIHLPYPIPAPASMPEATDARDQTTADTDLLLAAALNNLDAANRLLSLHEPKAPGAHPTLLEADPTQLSVTSCSEKMANLYPEFSRGWNACLECVIEQLTPVMPDATGREDLDVWSTEEMELLADYFDNWVPPQAKSPGGTQ